MSSGNFSFRGKASRLAALQAREMPSQARPSHNKWASGSGRLRRPPTQPATSSVRRCAEVIERRKQVLETEVRAGSEALNVMAHVNEGGHTTQRRRGVCTA